jgi:uncharacterized protein (TIGR00369 family)
MTIFGADVPFARLCGIEEVEATGETTRLRMTTGPDHQNNRGLVHGGAICTLLDVAMGSVARLKAERPVVTVDMQVAFLSAARHVLFAEGRIVRAGRSLIFAEADVTSEDGALVARATGVFRPMRD